MTSVGLAARSCPRRVPSPGLFDVCGGTASWRADSARMRDDTVVDRWSVPAPGRFLRVLGQMFYSPMHCRQSVSYSQIGTFGTPPE